MKNYKLKVIVPATNKKSTMRLNHFLSNKYNICFLVGGVDIAFLLLYSYIVNVIYSIPHIVKNIEECSKYFALNQLIPHIFTHHILYFIFLLFIILYDLILVYRIRTSLSEDYFNVGQKGSQRFLEIEEIREQYKEIEERKETFPGRGGLVISRYGKKLYIDDSITNNVFIGMTRSGKDEMYVFPTIDIMSRAQVQTSMIVIDPKMESYKSSKRTLEERGYDVFFICLDNPLNSAGYNPLTEIINAYKEGDIDGGETLAYTLAFAIYNPDKSTGDTKYFEDTSSNVLAALIIAHIEDCMYEDTLLNKKRKKAYVMKRKKYDLLEEEDFKEQVKQKYQEVLNEKDTDAFLNNFEYVPDSVSYYDVFPNEKMINMYSLINTFTELARQKIKDTPYTMLDLYFMNRPALNRAKFKYAAVELAGSRQKGNVFSNMLTKIAVFSFANVAKMTAETSFNIKELGFGERPMAIFLGLPDYDVSKNFIATIFIRQAYFVLAKACGENGRCKRPVKFIVNEAGNIPAIENLPSMTAVCLGRWISFDFYFQAYAMMDERYGEKGRLTILDNCSNEVFIFSKDVESRKYFAELMGNTTITDLQRTGEKLSLNKNFTENTTEVPLIRADDLGNLMEGECIIARGMKRRDLNDNRIKPLPIFNSVEKKTNLIYRKDYLAEDFPDADKIRLSDVNTESRRHIYLKDRVWDYKITFQHFDDPEFLQEKEKKIFKDIDLKLYNHVKEILGVKNEFDNYYLDEIITKLVDSEIKDYEKNAMIDLLQRVE